MTKNGNGRIHSLCRDFEERFDIFKNGVRGGPRREENDRFFIGRTAGFAGLGEVF